MPDNELIQLPSAEVMKAVVVTGDLSKLSPDQQNEYYLSVCRSLGLNPITQPFAFLTLNGRKQLYPLKSCTDQLRRLYGISLVVTQQHAVDDLYVVTASASMKDGRQDSDVGVVPLGQLKGEARSNAIMKAVTKAKRRVTLSICGLGMLDESELESIPGARTEPAPALVDAGGATEAVSAPPPQQPAPPKNEPAAPAANGKRTATQFLDELEGACATIAIGDKDGIAKILADPGVKKLEVWARDKPAVLDRLNAIRYAAIGRVYEQDKNQPQTVPEGLL